jgi:hypothetical protein
MIHLGYFATNLWYQLSIKHGKTLFSIGNSISRWILLADINNKSRKFRSLYKIIKDFKMLRSFEVFMARLSLQKRGTSNKPPPTTPSHRQVTHFCRRRRPSDPLERTHRVSPDVLLRSYGWLIRFRYGYESIPMKIPFLEGWTSILTQLFWCELQGYYWFWPTAILGVLSQVFGGFLKWGYPH